MRKVDFNTLISVVIPIYNEIDVIDALVNELRSTFAATQFPGRCEIVLVDDGSTDGSTERLDQLARANPAQIKVVHLARNFGHAPAVRAGLDHATGDAVILMDGDMQDDPVAFAPFIEKWLAGYDVVYAVRSSRQERYGAPLLFQLFYRMLNRVAEIAMPLDAGNFSLMDRRVVNELSALPERNRYLPGLRAWVGHRQIGVPVPRRARYDGSTRVGIKGLWRLANNAVFSFSHVPLTMFRTLGVIAVVFSTLLIAYACYGKLAGLTIKAWMSQFITITFFGGVNLLGVGVIGEYVVRIYDEVKRRPTYIVDRVAGGSRGQVAETAAAARATAYAGETRDRAMPAGKTGGLRLPGVLAVPE
jgi:glycosyltransferase involved in cell wall biosynthesis